MTISLRFAARSDVGLVRQSNQDSGYAGPHLCLLCDGMGGPAGGDIASAVAVEHLMPLDADSHQAGELLGLMRDAVQAALREEWQVGSGVYYPIPNHRLASLAHYAEGLELPGTEQAARECLSLPVHPSLSDADLERIGQAVAATVKAGA
mgnify:FL=1